MPRYAAFLRGVMPTNCKMPALRAAFEAAGFEDVKTILGSGNVAFDAKKAPVEALAKKAEAAMQKELGRVFPAIVRSIDELQALLDSDPYRDFKIAPDAKRIVTFLREAPSKKPSLPIEQDGAGLYALHGRELFSAYVRSPKGPVFMTLIEKTFGKGVTTRTWDTLQKVSRA